MQPLHEFDDRGGVMPASCVSPEKWFRTFDQTARHCPREKTVYELFEMQGSETPYAIAVALTHVQLSYDALNTRANHDPSTSSKSLPFRSWPEN